MSLSTIHVSITSKVTHEINNTDRISEKCMSVKRSLQSKKNTRSELKSKEDSFLKIEKRKKTISTYQSRLTCMSRKNVSNSESLKQRKTLLENLNKSARFYRRYSCSQFKLIKRPLSPISSQNSDVRIRSCEIGS
jgi:exonuclease VII large subunit